MATATPDLSNRKPDEGDWTPRPDPTVLTTEALRREIGALNAIVSARIDGIIREMTRFEMQLDQTPALIDAKTNHLQSLHDEKFRSIQIQFNERDVRTEQTSRDSKVAVDAALQAAKEAVGEQNKSSALAIAKSETATAKQIDAQGILIQNSTAGLNDKIDDIKSRLTSIEGKSFGSEGKGQSVTSMASLGIAALAVMIAAGVALTTNHGTAVAPVTPLIQYVPVSPSSPLQPLGQPPTK